MRRAALILGAALSLSAQVSREPYREAYKQWREADPNLEHDAAAAGLKLGPRAKKMAELAARYEAARGAFLRQTAAETRRKFAWLETAIPEPPLPLTKGARALVASEAKAAEHSIETYADDPDPGIQKLRGMLEREKTALGALDKAMAAREQAADAARTASATLESARTSTLSKYRDVAANWTESAADADRESAAWAQYYTLLAEGARGSGPATSTSSAAAAAPEETPKVPEEPKPSITPVPLVRYTGAWTFPAVNGLFFGLQPVFADLVVEESNGHATGTLTARFRPAASLSGAPEIRFHFSGEFSSRRTQVFPLETSDGAKGTVELIPGPAFNLLEVNFQIQTDSKVHPGPGKVRQGDMVLVKK